MIISSRISLCRESGVYSQWEQEIIKDRVSFDVARIQQEQSSSSSVDYSELKQQQVSQIYYFGLYLTMLAISIQIFEFAYNYTN